MVNLLSLLAEADQEVRQKHYPKGQIIFYQGDHTLEVAILTNGYIKVYDIDDQGNEKILHILRQGALAPFSFFSGKKEQIHWFYSALTDCDVYVIDMDVILDRVKKDSELSLALMNWFSYEVKELLTRLSSLGKSTAREKVMAALIFLSDYCSKQRPSGWKRVSFPVNHQLLADMTGVTRESAAMIMKELAKKGIVRNPRQTILEIKLKEKKS